MCVKCFSIILNYFPDVFQKIWKYDPNFCHILFFQMIFKFLPNQIKFFKYNSSVQRVFQIFISKIKFHIFFKLCFKLCFFFNLSSTYFSKCLSNFCQMFFKYFFNSSQNGFFKCFHMIFKLFLNLFHMISKCV